jgi:hypothetical protein
MTVHALDLASIHFAREYGSEHFPPLVLRVAEARCACGLRYHVSTTTLPRSVVLLDALVLWHLHAMQQIGEPVRRWPVVAA